MDIKKRNKLAGKHKSYDKLGMSDAAIRRKRRYDTKYHKTEERKKYRSSLNAANRKAGTYGNNDGRDMGHTRSGKLESVAAKLNRAANGQGKRSKFHK